MLIQLIDNCPQQELENIMAQLKTHGFKGNLVETLSTRYIISNGKKEADIRLFGNLPGVKDIHIVEDDNKLVSRKWRVEDTIIDFGDGIQISRKDLTIVMGPCAIEDEQQVDTTLEFLKENNIRFMRGGIFKPRSSPYSFRGLGIEGLKFFSQKCKAAGIKVVTEVMQVSQIEEMYDYIDVFQVGTRNAQNFNLLDELGKTNKPVLLKRGMSSTIQEFLASAEYIFSNGNEKIILCERGIRTFEKAYRNTMDINAIPYLHDKSHLPVFSDPSHAVGIRDYVEPIALSSVMAGADGVLIEIHQCPQKAVSDGAQTLDFFQARRTIQRLRETVALRNKIMVG
ncbi:MAG: 3-deoxy-7-phosphoheptulonate synthase [Bacteroidetes bacterium]|nr:MAG: 3-deoxy-7-phosphoheptulonate synthase [Bacteroidota bacterium]